MYKLEKLILGTFASFVETGTTFGTAPINTVSRALYPATTTYASVWNSLGDVLDSAPEKKEASDNDVVPSVYGNYDEIIDTWVTQDLLKLSLKSHSEPIHRMIWGLSAKITDAAAVTPFAKRDRFVEGWLNFQLRGQDAADRVVAALYGRMRLDADPKWSKDPTKPAVKFEILRSPIQTIVPNYIATV